LSQQAAASTVCKAGVIDNRPLLANRQVWQLRLLAPEIAASVQPGQFVHLQVPGFAGHILRRPFSVYSADATTGEIAIVYQLVGSGSRQMTSLAPDSSAPDSSASNSLLAPGSSAPGSLASNSLLAPGSSAPGRSAPGSSATGGSAPGSSAPVSLIGPIGRGWQPPASAQRVLLVGGGVGIAPLYMLAKRLLGQGVAVEVVIGAQNTSMIVCKHDIAGLLPSGSLHITTDDGSEGIQGFTTAATGPLLAAGGFDYLACCGPEPMQKATAALATEHAVACEVSLERRMACGIGACLSCAVSTTQAGEHQLGKHQTVKHQDGKHQDGGYQGSKRACVDGPVFDAQEVLW
jgi:dihydroorotate dehydrogenase electron transfer subunit